MLNATSDIISTIQTTVVQFNWWITDHIQVTAKLYPTILGTTNHMKRIKFIIFKERDIPNGQCHLKKYFSFIVVVSFIARKCQTTPDNTIDQMHVYDKTDHK